MDRIGEFVAMDGQGLYVWPAFAIAVGLLLAMAVHAWLTRRALQRRLETLQTGRPGRTLP